MFFGTDSQKASPQMSSTARKIFGRSSSASCHRAKIGASASRALTWLVSCAISRPVLELYCHVANGLFEPEFYFPIVLACPRARLLGVGGSPSPLRLAHL